MRLGSGNQRTHPRACHASPTPLRIDTALRRLVQKNSTPGGHGQRAIRTTRKVPAPDGGGTAAHRPAVFRAFPIRRERWVGMLEESVATELQSAQLEVSATAQCRGSP